MYRRNTSGFNTIPSILPKRQIHCQTKLRLPSLQDVSFHLHRCIMVCCFQFANESTIQIIPMSVMCKHFKHQTYYHYIMHQNLCQYLNRKSESINCTKKPIKFCAKNSVIPSNRENIVIFSNSVKEFSYFPELLAEYQ